MPTDVSLPLSSEAPPAPPRPVAAEVEPTGPAAPEPSCISLDGRLAVASAGLDSFGSALGASEERVVVGDSGLHSPWPRPVLVYTRRGDRWALEKPLEPLHTSEGAILFGQAVAVDGDRVAVSVFNGSDSDLALCDEVELHTLQEDGAWEL